MRYIKVCLALLLAASAVSSDIARAAVPSRAHSSTAAVAAPQGGAQADAAAAEREAGRGLLRQGKAGEALVRLEKALALYRQAGDKSGEAATRDLLGDLYERQGRYDVALEHYQGAHEIYAGVARTEAAQNQVVAALSPRQGTFNANLMLAKIGDMYYRQGKAGDARSAYSRMTVVRPETDTLKAAQGGKSNLQSTKSRIGGFGSRMRGVLSGTPSTSTPSEATGVVTDTVGAIRGPFDAYREAVIYSAHELGMGRADFLTDQLDSARKHFENVLAATVASLPLIGGRSRTRLYRAAARTSLGDVAHAQARFADAVKLYTEAAKGARADERPDLLWPALRGTGRSLLAQAARETDAKKATKMREDALISYREALKAIEEIRQGSLRADESRTTFLATTEEVFDEASAALAEMALTTQAAPAPLEGKALDYAAEALAVVEQGRARSLLDLLSETRANITQGVPADLLQKKQENQRRQEEIAAELTGVSLTGAQPSKSLDDLESELNRLQVEFDSVENQIRSASPRYAALTAGQPLSLADLRQRVLDEKTALLEYSLGAEQSYLYVVTNDRAQVFRLPPRGAVEQRAVTLRERILAARRSASAEAPPTAGAPQRGLALTPAEQQAASTAAAEYAKEAHALYQMLVEPAAALTKDKRLLVVADGALNYVPFGALVTSAPAAGADFSALPFLIKTNETVSAPSGSVVAAIRQQSSGGASSPGPMLLVADPVFDGGDARARGAKPDAGADETRGLSLQSAVSDVNAAAAKPSAGASSQAGKVAVMRLPGTRAEAQEIARLAGTAGRKADTWLDLEASEANVEGRDLAQYGVVHFATHGLLNAERPQFTGVVLSLVGNTGGVDGFLRTDEVFNLRLGRPLVMLSACETGLGRERRGEGVIGLTRAFMYAGARTVGVSLWSVADRPTARLMGDFYKDYFTAGGAGAGAALRSAQLKMIAEPRYAAPYYWAPFVMVGDWN